MAQPTRGLVPHVQVGTGSLFGWFDNPESQVSSHLWLSRTGEFEGYVPLDQKAWAQAAGNPYWISCECEGFPSEDYTPIQVQRLGELFAWGVREFGWKAEITDSPNGYGLGTHRMGGAAWGGHECPGPIRAGRRADILAAAAAILTPPAPEAPVDVVLSATQLQAITDELLGRIWELMCSPPQPTPAGWHQPYQRNAVDVWRRTYEQVGAAVSDTTAIRAALATMVDESHPAAAMLAVPPAVAGPLTLDELLAAVLVLGPLEAARLAEAAAGHAASLLATPTVPTPGATP
ncbi:N-acetylmuramoyl-L-alanine amidase [Frankia sp. AgB32]|uniref:peptidoglycan recognition protein family protein n=1 Tax=Frankia sp. AgB32 TaxID=631119 RepID=UPI00200F1A71|nr:N-acetylmuramoyl-L-alanine amidase [Frankia sp. AgB32]MCK9896986.1 N-acetylmuramoyl-L-alanine amidase [Frankia sp. AgB32]